MIVNSWVIRGYNQTTPLIQPHCYLFQGNMPWWNSVKTSNYFTQQGNNDGTNNNFYYVLTNFQSLTIRLTKLSTINVSLIFQRLSKGQIHTLQRWIYWGDIHPAQLGGYTGWVPFFIMKKKGQIINNNLSSTASSSWYHNKWSLTTNTIILLMYY